MDFGGGNPFADTLRAARFMLVVEQNVPAADQALPSAVALGRAIAERAADEELVAAISLTDRLRHPTTHDPLAFAEEMVKNNRLPILLTIAGKGSTSDRVLALAARAKSSGVRTFCCVTGDGAKDHPPVHKPRVAAPYPAGYLDGVDTTRLLRRHDRSFCIGAGVNPFKYNLADQYLQYYKMIRKLESGADFLITHAGWDMKKLQELQWFLRMRDLGHGVLARVRLLNPEDVNELESSVCPGIYVPREFTAALQRECTVNSSQFLAAQLRRLGLQVAGCRLLGYSGVVLAGIRNPSVLDMVLKEIKRAVQEHTSYTAWLEAWNDYHGGLQFAPVPSPFYAFQGLMTPEHADYDPVTCHPTAATFAVPRLADRVGAIALPLLLSAKAPEPVRSATRFLLRRHDTTPPERLSRCWYLDNSSCPKRLTLGPCGGSGPRGACEFGQGPCFFHRIFALATARHELDLLEEKIDG
jgi:methylenetetrahydrofolate reductase (NADPH)